MQDWRVKALIMPKKPKKPSNNSRESTLGPLARVLGEIDADKTSANKPTEIGPEEPGGGDDSGSVPEGEARPEGETPEGL